MVFFVIVRKRYISFPFQAIPARLASVQPINEVSSYFVCRCLLLTTNTLCFLFQTVQ